MKKLAARALAPEQMDANDLDPRLYAHILADLALVNRITLAARPTLKFLDQAAIGTDRLRILDVGYGNGDMLRKIWTWAQKRKLDCELVGIDLNPSSLVPAQKATPAHIPIRFHIGDYAELAHEHWDVVISSLVTHHMNEEERIAFLDFMDRIAKRGWFINDLYRHCIPYLGYPLLARIMGVHRIVREDGQLSIARSFRHDEWATMLAGLSLNGTLRVFHQFPFRLCVSCLR